MKKVKICLLLLLALVFVVLCSGCNSKEQKLKVLEEKILSPFEQENIAELHMQQEQDDLCIELNHIVFEEEQVILDYTMKSSDLSKYEDVFPQFHKGNLKKGDGNSIILEERPKEKRLISYIEVAGGAFLQQDIGEKIELSFESFNGNLGSGIDVVFPLTIENVFSSKVLNVEQGFPCENQTVVVKGIKISKFHTGIQMDIEDCPAFTEKFYNWEITDDSGNILAFLNGSEDTYNYTALPEDCSEIGLTLIKYREGKKDLSYDKVGETVKIPIR